MKDFRVVADSSCLIGLSLVDQFELLKELFSDIYIPYAVYNEVVIVGRGEVGSEETEHAVKSGWILKKTVRDKIAVNALSTILGEGESEVITLCEELGLDCALIDERKARDMAELMGISTMGVLGVIDLAIENGFLIVKKRVVDQLINLGFRVSDRLYKKMFPDLK